MPTVDHIVLIGNGVLETDIDLFFGPLEGTEQIHRFGETVKYPEVFASIGIFSSRSDASRNGWNKEIPDGFSDLTIGKKRKTIGFLKIKE